MSFTRLSRDNLVLIFFLFIPYKKRGEESNAEEGIIRVNQENENEEYTCLLGPSFSSFFDASPVSLKFF